MGGLISHDEDEDPDQFEPTLVLLTGNITRHADIRDASRLDRSLSILYWDSQPRFAVFDEHLSWAK